jgi:hypothetical protein
MSKCLSVHKHECVHMCESACVCVCLCVGECTCIYVYVQSTNAHTRPNASASKNVLGMTNTHFEKRERECMKGERERGGGD